MKKVLLRLLIIISLLALPYSCDIGVNMKTNTGGTGGVEEPEYQKGPNYERMQQFIMDISSRARKVNSQFIIIPQNGEELAFIEIKPSRGLSNSLVNAIDGFGIEELFYDGKLQVDRQRVSMLQQIRKRLTVMVADYVSDDADIPDSIKRSLDEGFIAFPRSRDNYDYKYIPSEITNENDDNINSLGGAKNYLYLIGPDSGKYPNKNALINAIAATNYDVILIDLLLYGTAAAFTKSEIQQLKTKANKGKRLVISYISIGSAENNRYYWQKGWEKGNPSWLRENYQGYPNEYWVEFWNQEWRTIIFDYIDRIVNAGFDGAYLDNVEVYSRLK